MLFTLSEIYAWKLLGVIIGGFLLIYSSDKFFHSSGGRGTIFWIIMSLVGFVIAVTMILSIVAMPAISDRQLDCMNSLIHQNLSISTEYAARMCPP